MYNDYYTSASGGFTDEAHLHELLLNTLLSAGLIFICLIVAGLCAFVAFRRALHRGRDISGRLNYVSKAIATAATGSQTEVATYARTVLEADEVAFGRLNALTKVLEAQAVGLSKALAPTGERDETADERRARVGQGGGHTVSGGTVINIAVSQSGQCLPLTGQATETGPQAVPVAMPPKSPGYRPDKIAGLWLAVQKLSGLWRDKALVQAYYHNAQAQLCRADIWVAPDTGLLSGQKPHVP